MKDKNGFLFDFDNYENIRYQQNFEVLDNIKNNISNIKNVLKQAYSIDIEKWNLMSNMSNQLNDKKYNKKYCINTNLRLCNMNKNKEFNKKYKIFVKFQTK